MHPPRTRKPRNARAHGASSRRARTTRTTEARMRAITTGLVVLVAATARPSAHTHHARGCIVISLPPSRVPSVLPGRPVAARDRAPTCDQHREDAQDREQSDPGEGFLRRSRATAPAAGTGPSE